MNVFPATRVPLAVFLLATCVAPGHAQSSSPPREVAAPHVSVSLVADPAAPAIAPRVGLRFTLDPGWHVYWRNPGDSGAPPSARWTQLPPGWSAGDLLWPVPERIPLGPLVNYGYTGDVVLPVTMTAVPQATGPARLVADVRWLVCHDVCVPGKATLGLPWPLPESDRRAAGDWAKLIADARRQVPLPAPPGWKVSAREAGDSIVVTVRGDAKAGRGVFFPIDESVVAESAPQKVEASAGVVTFTLKKSDQLTTMPKALRGVVKFDSGAAYEVAAPFGRE